MKDGIIEAILLMLADRIERGEQKYIRTSNIMRFGFKRSIVYRTVEELYKRGWIEPFDRDALTIHYFKLSRLGLAKLKEDLQRRKGILNIIKEITGIEPRSQIERLNILNELLEKVERLLLGNPRI